MNRRAVKPLLAAAVMVLATFFALFVLTPSNAEEIAGTGTTSSRSATATDTTSASPSASASASGGKNCGDCERPRD
jgi:hypothetical protein